MRFILPFATALAASILPLLAQDAPIGLNSLPEVEFSELSQVDPNPLGTKALAIRPEQWKHGETDHFIYHFVHGYVATPVSLEAEFYYRVIAKELLREQEADTVGTKSHIYIFEQPQTWHEFQKNGKLEPWTGGIQSGGSLFILRNSAYKFASNVLGHEIAHLALHRFYADGVPCWLNEGFAQYVSKDAHASYQRARGYLAKPHSEAIAPQDFIPLTTLVSMTQPPSDHVKTFYDESERLVRFLVATDKSAFLALLDALGRHQPLETALPACYAGKFTNLSALEKTFRDYASKDFGTSLRQVNDE
jgi:Peptidase MA superfamily